MTGDDERMFRWRRPCGQVARNQPRPIVVIGGVLYNHMIDAEVPNQAGVVAYFDKAHNRWRCCGRLLEHLEPRDPEAWVRLPDFE